ncbi:hypothetical protein MOQ76_24245 [Klebsiella pneumoniae]|nr:hypothetical protein MOQ76_24245 [Klebsiella pneumoniae]
MISTFPQQENINLRLLNEGLLIAHNVKLYAVPHFQVEGMDVNLSLVSQMPKAKA